MLIQPICGFGIRNRFYSQQSAIKQKNTYLPYYKNVAFLGSTTAGQPIKRLHRVPDALFGIITIRSDELNHIEKDLKLCKTVKQAVKYLKKYKEENMLKTEKAILERFEKAAPNSPRMQLQDLLKQWYPEALTQLKLEEFAVIDDIDKMSLKFSPETMLKIRKETTKCRTTIIENDPLNTFKRKRMLGNLMRIDVKPGEEKLMKDLMIKALYMPNSATSENAFIVKYAGRSHNEIAYRLISQSLLTIDHALADSKGGPNDIGNFIGASAGANSLKRDMPLKMFIKRFPEAIQNCQKYIEFFIRLINHGGFRGNEAYPYKLKKRLVHESNGKIKLNLSGLKYTKEESEKLEKISKMYHKIANKEKDVNN